jgi:hypothetical protein
MREESRYLRNHSQARAAIKDVVEMPDFLADRIIRSIAANGGQLSNALRQEIPILSEPGVWDDLVQAVTRAFV